MSKHYIAMAGLSGGYIPNYVSVHETKKGAIENLAFLHDLSPKYLASLFGSGEYCVIDATDRQADNWGNSLLEVYLCDCPEANIHNEDDECFSCGEKVRNWLCKNPDCKYSS